MRRYISYIQIFIRSFFIQSAWNYKSLLSIGFCFSIVPVAKKLYKNDIKKYNQFVKRHLGFFNAHPYFSAFALGAVTRLEEEVEQANGDEVQVEKLKNALIGPLGALGDQLFWATIKPATFTLGVLGFLLVENVNIRLIFLLLLAILYNAPHLYIRIFGMMQGYKEGFLVCKYLKIDNFKFIKTVYSVVGIIAIGLVAGYVGATRLGYDFYALFVFISSIVVAIYFKSKKAKTYVAMLLPLLIAIIVGIIKSKI
jgi:PTS system mannose-specific IID component